MDEFLDKLVEEAEKDAKGGRLLRIEAIEESRRSGIPGLCSFFVDVTAILCLSR